MRNAVLLFLFPLLFIACGTDPSTDKSNADEGKKDLTIPEIEERILADPSNASLFSLRAKAYERIDSTRLAVNDWGRAISLDSTNAQWRIGLGDLYFRKIKLPEAEEHFGAAIRLDPKGTGGRSKLSEVYLVQLRFKEAMALANDALRIDPNDAELYNLKGWIHRTAGDTALAISSYQTAVEQDPDYYDALISLGILHAARRNYLAIQYYDAALHVRPRSVEALYNKGVFAQDIGNDSLALACYASIKEIEPNYPLAFYNTGYVLLEHQQRVHDARHEFAQAIKLLPDYTQAYYSRGVTYEREGALDSALLDYRQALRLDPGYTDAAMGLERLQRKGLKVPAR